MDLGKTAHFLFVNWRVLFLKPHVCSPLVLPSERGLYSSFSIPSGMLHSHMLRGVNTPRACIWDREAAATFFSWKPAFSVTVYYSSLKHVDKTFLREAGKGDGKLRYCCGLRTSVYNFLNIYLPAHQHNWNMSQKFVSTQICILWSVFLGKSCSVHLNFYCFIGALFYFTYFIQMVAYVANI